MSNAHPPPYEKHYRPTGRRSKDVVYWDKDLSGFGLKVTPKGRKVFLVLYCTRDGFEGRFDYTAIGTVVNLAARLCEWAKANESWSTARCARQLRTRWEPSRLASSFRRDSAGLSIYSTFLGILIFGSSLQSCPKLENTAQAVSRRSGPARLGAWRCIAKEAEIGQPRLGRNAP
jgi:hypothetical protein